MTAIRKVVTGYAASGKAVVVAEERIDSSSPDFGDKWSIWAADEVVSQS